MYFIVVTTGQSDLQIDLEACVFPPVIGWHEKARYGSVSLCINSPLEEGSENTLCNRTDSTK